MTDLIIALREVRTKVVSKLFWYILNIMPLALLIKDRDYLKLLINSCWGEVSVRQQYL